MERSLAEELYPEILKVLNTGFCPQSITDNAIHNSHDIDEGDLWDDDEDMERQWQRRQKEFLTIGYRDGLVAGKEASAQEGFSLGFKESVCVGQTWGVVRGLTSALAGLPDALKERLVVRDDKRNRLQHLHRSVRDISTTDAVRLFSERLNNRSSEKGGSTGTSSSTADLHGHFSDEDVIDNHVHEFNMLVPELSGLTVHCCSGF